MHRRRGLSQLFAAGPAVVAAIGEDSDREELGGSDLHTRNGVVDDEAASEAAAFARAAALLSYLPSRVGARRPRGSPKAAGSSRAELIEVVPGDPKRVYSMRRVLAPWSTATACSRWVRAGAER